MTFKLDLKTIYADICTYTLFIYLIYIYGY
jgi:hypothetical protein